MSRPLSIWIICLLWSAGSLFTIYSAASIVIEDVSYIPYIPQLDAWFSIALPIEIILNIITVIVAGVAIGGSVGLWFRAPWSRGVVLKTLWAEALIQVGGFIIYLSRPADLTLNTWSLVISISVLNWYRGYSDSNEMGMYLGEKLIETHSSMLQNVQVKGVPENSILNHPIWNQQEKKDK